MKDSIQLSIIIPVYNVEEYLIECLESAYKITGLNKEIIIINDGSTDKSDVIIDKFLQLYPDETVVETQLNKGQSVARNVGLKLAKGSYILFLDSDDTLDYDAVTEIFNYAQQHNLDLVQARATVFGDVPRSLMPMPEEVLNTPKCSGISLLEKYCNVSSIEKADFRPEVWLMLLKRELFINNNIQFTPGMYYEDELMIPTLFLCATNVKALDVPFYNYRIRQGSTIRSVGEIHIASKAKLVKEYYSLLSRNDFYHPFLNGRLVGWCREAQLYLSFKDILSLFLLRKYTSKDFILLNLILLKSILRLGKHKSIEEILSVKK